MNPHLLMKHIENAQPLWTPGTYSGYHAITFGWIVDGLIRKVDPMHRGIKQFFDEEIAKPYRMKKFFLFHFINNHIRYRFFFWHFDSRLSSNGTNVITGYYRLYKRHYYRCSSLIHDRYNAVAT